MYPTRTHDRFYGDAAARDASTFSFMITIDHDRAGIYYIERVFAFLFTCAVTQLFIVFIMSALDVLRILTLW